MQGITWRAHVPCALRFSSTALACKEAGNKHHRDCRWLAAAITYTRGLALDPSNVILRANRAESYLKLEYFSAAQYDAEKALESMELPKRIRQKVLLRAGRAVYSQGNFDRAIHYFKASCECDPTLPDSDIWIHRALSRLVEQKYGRYDWIQLFLESQSSKTVMDVADYVGPVKISNTPHGGRCMVATRDVKIGELLVGPRTLVMRSCPYRIRQVVAKPFVAVFPEELSSSETILAVNMLTKDFSRSCSFAVITKVVEKIHGNPELHDLVFHLCPGPSYPKPPGTYPPQVASSQLYDRNPLNPSVDINIALLESICTTNMFMPQPLGFGQDTPDMRSDLSDSPSALYLLPSMINHSCMENATRTFFREVMVIRAKSKISQGEEITLLYTTGDTASVRQKCLSRYNFTCICPMCEDDRADGEDACGRREELVRSFESLEPANVTAVPTTVAYRRNINTLESLIKQVSETYTSSHRVAVRLPLMRLHNRLSHEHYMQAIQHDHQLYHRAIAEEMKAIEATGVPVIDKSTMGHIFSSRQRSTLPIKTTRGPTSGEEEACVKMMLMIVKSFLALGDHSRAERWLRTAWWGQSLFASDLFCMLISF